MTKRGGGGRWLAPASSTALRRTHPHAHPRPLQVVVAGEELFNGKLFRAITIDESTWCLVEKGSELQARPADCSCQPTAAAHPPQLPIPTPHGLLRPV